MWEKISSGAGTAEDEIRVVYAASAECLTFVDLDAFVPLRCALARKVY